jgi:hypothetical protein
VNVSERNGDVIWRAQQFGAREGNAVKRTPFLAHVHNAQDGTRYRGGQIVSVSETEIGVKFLAEPTRTEQATVAIALKPGVRVGDPVVCELESSGYAIAALHDGAFTPPGPPDQEAAVTAGEFWPSRIVESLWNT